MNKDKFSYREGYESLEIAEDIVDNFKDITGYNISDLINHNTSQKSVFVEDLVFETTSLIADYVEKEYDVNFKKFDNGRILELLDQEIIHGGY